MEANLESWEISNVQQKVAALQEDQYQLAHQQVLFLANTQDHLFNLVLLHFAHQ
jgi:hypothetical protein